MRQSFSERYIFRIKKSERQKQFGMLTKWVVPEMQLMFSRESFRGSHHFRRQNLSNCFSEYWSSQHQATRLFSIRSQVLEQRRMRHLLPTRETTATASSSSWNARTTPTSSPPSACGESSRATSSKARSARSYCARS